MFRGNGSVHLAELSIKEELHQLSYNTCSGLTGREGITNHKSHK